MEDTIGGQGMVVGRGEERRERMRGQGSGGT